MALIKERICAFLVALKHRLPAQWLEAEICLIIIKLKRQQDKTAANKMKKVLLTITVAAMTFVACDNRPNTTYMGTPTTISPSTSGDASSSTVITSSGYSPDPNYHPTVSSTGKYHTIDGNARQEQFQGSREQAEQLEMIRQAELEEIMSDYGLDY